MSSQRSVYVFLPKLGDEFQRDEWDKYLAEKMPQGVEPSVDQGREGEANPFAVVAFAIESTNHSTIFFPSITGAKPPWFAICSAPRKDPEQMPYLTRFLPA